MDFPESIKTFSKISEEYEFVLTNVIKELDNNIRLITNHATVTSPLFKYCTLKEAQEIKKEFESEINRKYSLELTASFESKLVFYFKNKIKKRSSLSMVYNRLSTQLRNGPQHLMYQHLIPIFKEVIFPIDNVSYAAFKNLVDYRNWLAHGRGEKLEPHLEKYDFDYSLEVINSIISTLPNYNIELSA